MRRLSWALGAVSLAVMAGLGLLTPAAAQAPVPDTTTTTAPDPNAVASRAAAAWSAPEPRIRTNPPPERAQVAGLATWLWVEPPGPLRFSSTDGPTTVALEARARQVRFELGDGATLTCAGTGTPYDASRPESAQSSACTHAWEATSGGETLQVRATVTWDIFFEGRPVGTEAASSDLDVAVAEAQALDRRPDPLSGAESDAGADADSDSGGRPLDELGELVPEEDEGCGFNPFCWGGKGLNALGDLAGGAWDGAKALATQVGGFFVGVVKGFGGLVAELFIIARGITKLVGAYDLVDWVITGDGAFDELKDTWGGLWDGVKTVFTTNPLTTGKSIWEGVWGPIRDSWKSGEYGEAVGRGAFDIAAAIVGTKGLSKAGKLKAPKKVDAPETAPKPAGTGQPKLLAEGNAFNKAREGAYPYNELIVEGRNGRRYRVDSYDPEAGEIVSRKNTQLADVQERTARRYLAEIDRKYAPGTRIADVPSADDLAGEKLEGAKILEVPVQEKPIPAKVLEVANQRKIIIRDPTGHTYNDPSQAAQLSGTAP